MAEQSLPFELPDTMVYPVLPLRDVVIFPHMVAPLLVGREKSIQAINRVLEGGKPILLVAQKNPELEDPTPDDLYTFGTIGHVVQVLALPNGAIKALVEGKERVRVMRYVYSEEHLQAYAKVVASEGSESQDCEALKRTVLKKFEQYLSLNRNNNTADLVGTIYQLTDLSQFADTVANHVNMKVDIKQSLLEKVSVLHRMEFLIHSLAREIEVQQTEKRILKRVKTQVESDHKAYYLNEQIKAIQKELKSLKDMGEPDEARDEVADLESTLERMKLPRDVKEKAQGELKKLKTMNPMAAEGSVVRNYLDWIISLPWGKRTRICKNLKKAEKILNEDHYGLDKVKERVLEFLAVQNRVDKVKGPILCIVGPPGVGKTSLGKSVARATGRNFVRIALGGVRDEAEIRGHRRTYIGAMPGKIIQGMKRAKSSNPLFLLDEIDKLGADWRGDPASALLEVLDPEQNSDFSDHYLEIGYDLSDVLFITTANSLNMPPPLLDRMEVIRISGYTEDEKIQIAKNHLIHRQRKLHGLELNEFSISDEALRSLVRQYCREAGVRNLEREIANLSRKAIKEIVLKKIASLKLTKSTLQRYAGIPRYRFGVADLVDAIGVTTGLAWTEVGGVILKIEAIMLPGKGKMILTGKLGEVMQESIQAASSFVRSRAAAYGILPTVFEKKDIHIHVPEGATPKDGPSAGVAMFTSIVSLLSGIQVRGDVAMTGELSLRGKVLPVGGIKEKLLAAAQAGLNQVLIPEENVKDLEEIPDNIKKDLKIIPVATVEEALKHALRALPEPIEWKDEILTAAATPRKISPFDAPAPSPLPTANPH